MNVLPQIVAKLVNNPKLAILLYNEIQIDDSKRVPKTDVLNYSSLNAQAAVIQKYYGDFIDTSNDLVEKWEADLAANQFSTRLEDYLDHASYNNLVKLGKPIVPLVMERYARERIWFWHELLHEIVYGHKSGARSFKETVLFAKWKELYEGGDT